MTVFRGLGLPLQKYLTVQFKLETHLLQFFLRQGRDTEDLQQFYPPGELLVLEGRGVELADEVRPGLLGEGCHLLGGRDLNGRSSIR